MMEDKGLPSRLAKSKTKPRQAAKVIVEPRELARSLCISAKDHDLRNTV